MTNTILSQLIHIAETEAVVILLKVWALNKDELRLRLISSTDRDLRYYILKSIEAQQKINPISYK